MCGEAVGGDRHDTLARLESLDICANSGDRARAVEAQSDAARVADRRDDPGSEQILGQVLGAEELNVFLQLELLLFKDDVELPEAGK